MAFKKNRKLNNDFNKVTISLASPESILESSHGEVTQPETINYRTYKPEMGGLFCERIFGPVKDWECHCGKYKRIRYKGIICDRCGVEVTEKKVRRERMGHIELVVPVAHIWYFKSLPNKIGYLLGLPTKKLDQIIYYERYVVIQPGIKEEEGISYMDFLTEDEYLDILDKLPRENQMLDDEDPQKFIAKMGAEGLEMLLSRLQLDEMSYALRHQAATDTSQQRKAEALKRLRVVEAFRDAKTRIENRPEWMIIKMVPVIPPELRPLVPLDGGRFATSDLNDLYRRVIIRNNRLKRLIDIKAPEVILRNEKRMLQEAVDSLFDNSRKVNAVRSDGNRALKSLSDMLKGKQGRFRQNLLGKRVDYSGRSVIVVGPELKLHECGLPKDMAAELFKPFIIRKLIERGIVKTVKSAKKIVDRKDPVVWDILENVLKGHPVLLNRAPTLHRLGIQAFQPKLIEGKAIQLHPLVCTAFNADFDGDQMAVHVPLGHDAVLEASMLMLSSHNILNPANGNPITVPSQDMVLGLYYVTKGRRSTDDFKVEGEGMRFYSAEEVIIALNEGKLSKHAYIHVKTKVRENEELVEKVIETVAGRVLFNQTVPEKVGFVNELLTKKKLQKIIQNVVNICGVAETARFLDDIKELGFQMAYQGGLSMGLDDIHIPDNKDGLIESAKEEVDAVWQNYLMGLITDNERYNQVIDIWTRVNTRLTNGLMQEMEEDRQGFNSIYMMMHSGARGSREQIRQLGGMRGLMAKPQKNLAGSVGAIIENPILSNFKEGLDVLEYFISTHGARKGLADTALKTADAGYLTRRLVDVAQDCVVNEEDCGTLRGLTVSALKDNEDVVEALSERVLGRVSVHDIYDPITEELIIASGDEFTEKIAEQLDESAIEEVEIRSVLTCESKKGVCSKCYGRNLSTNKMVQRGESVGVIAAQSIGEPGTQLTLRTFHVGGTASNIAVDAMIQAKFDGVIQFEELRSLPTTDDEGNKIDIVMGRTGEIQVIDPKSKKVLISNHVPYGAVLKVKEGDKVEKGQELCKWDPYNAVILSEFDGSIEFDAIEEGITFKEVFDEQTGHREKVITDTKDKNKNPAVVVNYKDDSKSYNIPVGAHLAVEIGDKVKVGQPLAKIPRTMGKSRDITGGLPRVTELFEARNPSNPAVVSEIDGVVTYGGIKRGNREIFVESKDGVKKKYMVPLSKHILVQDNDFVRAGYPLSDGAITPNDILNIQGPTAVQEYLVNEIQEVYRLQGVKINDKHCEVIVKQMMQKVEIMDAGDTQFLPGQVADKFVFMEENDAILDMKVVSDAGDSENLKPGQIVSPRELRDENSSLKRRDLKLVEVRDAQPAVSKPKLQGITQASLGTDSFISAASFQETTKVLSEASIKGKADTLNGLKENVIVGHLIPAGTGMREYDNLIVGNKEELETLEAAQEAYQSESSEQKVEL
ncbi:MULTISPECIES: DNA-directed RNA polymerase subunit beta' [Roseivirga]|jgi:DNA-directed RNA polymerase subunit beta'|uniref:DNA-directed RNA polymerase subunit beta' n=1 Tax=Roseivirga spongicola TaxID=333140 RepID=A0A150X997_9BACT|nr:MULTISPECIES: DNA-directed RNA polymerase subunit beta' [Roseivirga]PWL27488.1 MAG: DNA-directed RNA polymerase subunit beta' [Roseivirga sp. XM-24bin3]KYG75260.1 DNA-directed RNA polymerase subunit beta' [Roseivirga spongicola]MBO6494878.1 DNA-directed RNA polymerase subunit beta' [Roseivirga sp.]MBO6661954.1 DNA-directed RNA polymerase subunit beta' [Roseivirga sp.]MBO6909457.1 DNA-directed RNA polymerase subunit beta' [Roseivirga sp.]